VLNLQKLTGVTKAESAKMLAIIKAKYAAAVVAAKAGTDAIKKAEEKLQDDVNKLTMTGEDLKLQTIEDNRKKDLEGLEHLKQGYAAEYARMVALTNQKYDAERNAAQGFYATVEQAAAAEGFKTRAELEHTAQVALDTYRRMLESGEFTQEALYQAKLKSEKAQLAIGKISTDGQIEMAGKMADAISGMMQALGIKSKAVAYAASIIHTYESMAKTYALLGWPAAIPGMAIALATGIANTAKIAGVKAGYAEGTPNLDFLDFGKMSMTQLHNQEAVIPKGGGHQLAEEIAAALPTVTNAAMDRLTASIKDLAGGGAGAGPGGQQVTASLNIDGREFGQIVFQLSKAGVLRIQKTAVVTVT
jgi:hypothetical protein